MSLNIVLPDHGPGWSRLGNKIFQAMIAEHFLELLQGDVLIHGCQLPGYFATEYLAESEVDLAELQSKGVWVDLTSQNIPYDLLVRRYEMGLLAGVTVSMWGMRIQNLMDSLPRLNQYLDVILAPISAPKVSNRELLINIRLGELATDNLYHPDYYPLPISYYQRLVSDTGLKPVFLGQLTASEYLLKLSTTFPSAVFLEPDILPAFKAIREAKHKALAVSSFSFLAGWTGSADSNVIMPIAGLFNPIQRPDVNFIPPSDSRFSYRYFAPAKRMEGEGLSPFLERVEATSLGFPPA